MSLNVFAAFARLASQGAVITVFGTRSEAAGIRSVPVALNPPCRTLDAAPNVYEHV